MNTNKATQIAREYGYGKVFVRQNGEICMTNKSGKVILTMNEDFSIKFSRFNLEKEAGLIKDAMEVKKESSNIVNSEMGFYMKDTKKNWDLVNRYGFDAIEMTD